MERSFVHAELSPMAGRHAMRDSQGSNPDLPLVLSWYAAGTWSSVDQDHVRVAVPIGRCSMEIESRGRRGEARRERVSSPMISILPRHRTVEVRASAASQILVLHMHGRCLADGATALNISSRFEFVERGVVFDPFIRQLAVGLRLEIGERPDRRLLESASVVLARHLLQHYRIGPQSPSHGSLSPRRLNRVLEFIHANLCRPLALDEIAKQADVSAFHFARLFKTTVGIGPHQYVTRSRIERAKELLRQSSRSLADVAFECGFASQSYMTTVFHKHVGLTPKTFRTQES